MQKRSCSPLRAWNPRECRAHRSRPSQTRALFSGEQKPPVMADQVKTRRRCLDTSTATSGKRPFVLKSAKVRALHDPMACSLAHGASSARIAPGAFSSAPITDVSVLHAPPRRPRAPGSRGTRGGRGPGPGTGRPYRADESSVHYGSPPGTQTRLTRLGFKPIRFRAVLLSATASDGQHSVRPDPTKHSSSYENSITVNTARNKTARHTEACQPEKIPLSELIPEFG
ncbi:hypothetical protein P4O66_004736 [Electrophorus voltai]|uniref:Uncharacterized protein n=1 Tax=Electrophorus voltai TaxID=2609070 RepID=A0AAD9E0R0_9TELE|nr:hypothetical protein P4O66_004736 [Electrophorus voltai]